MSNTADYLVSPKGEIQFLALNRKVAKDMKPDSPEGYAIRIKYSSNTPEGAAWKETISKLNPNLIGTKHTEGKDEFTVRAFSRYLPEVLDGAGNVMEELPNFFKESTGTASMVIQPYTGNTMGNSINLIAIVIHELDVGSSTSTTETDRGAVLANLKALLKDSLGR